MNPKADVADLTERIRQTGSHATTAHRSGNGTPSQQRVDDLPAGPDRGLPPPPPLPRPPAAEFSDPVPLAEALTMIPRAREKLTVNPGVPGFLRPMFRNQGGFNGVLLETCGRLVEVGTQLRQENLALRARLDALLGYLGAQHAWLESLARSSSEWLNATQERFAEQDARSLRAEIRLDQAEAALDRVRGEGDDHAAILARLETQNELQLAWTQNLQAHADEQIARVAEVEARTARPDEHALPWQTQNERQTERIDVLLRRLDDATAACERARAELSQAVAQQHLLEANQRRLDERQINDASYLRAQLAFQQRLIGQWLAPASPGAGGPSATSDDAAGLGAGDDSAAAKL